MRASDFEKGSRDQLDRPDGVGVMKEKNGEQEQIDLTHSHYFWSEEHSRYYYQDPATGESVWATGSGRGEQGVGVTADPANDLQGSDEQADAPAQPEWETYWSEEHSRYFYFDAVSGKSLWAPDAADDRRRAVAAGSAVVCGAAAPPLPPQEEDVADLRSTEASRMKSESSANKHEQTLKPIPKRKKPRALDMKRMQRWSRAADDDDNEQDCDARSTRGHASWRADQIRSGAAARNVNFVPVVQDQVRSIIPCCAFRI